MSETTDDFAFPRALSKMIKNFLRAHVLIDGIVTTVNDNFTVDIMVQNTLYTNIPTKVLIGSQASIFEIPVVNTTCLIKWRDGSRSLPQVDSFDSVDTYYISPVNNLNISSKQIQFNDGSNGGIPLTPDLVTQYNTIINQQNQILGILKTIVIASTPFDFAPLFSAINNLTNVQDDDIQNPNITQ